MKTLLRKGVVFALLAALLFGASTPFTKSLVGDIQPLMLAALLYGGSGLGLSAWILVRRLIGRGTTESRLTAPDIPWLAGAVAAGGVVAPVLLMFGLTLIPASSASLLLNLEGVLTALLAWFVFKENFDQRIFLGMLSIIAAGALLSWQESMVGIPWGGLLVAGACLGWAIDNNLTRKVSASDPVQIAAIKGVVAGAVNLTIALANGVTFPAPGTILKAGAVGLVGYGISLVLFVLALRHLGTARTGAYFSTAPFVGAVVALVLLSEQATLLFWVAGGLMALGLWLHLTEHHEHSHKHEPLIHEHEHVHDEHHQHNQDFPWQGPEPHSHPHKHQALTHNHEHYPDLHHRHTHLT